MAKMMHLSQTPALAGFWILLACFIWTGSAVAGQTSSIQGLLGLSYLPFYPESSFVNTCQTNMGGGAGALSQTLNCNAPNIISSGEFNATSGGPLGVRASIDVLNANATSVQYEAIASFIDTLSFSGLVPFSATFSVHETGTITGPGGVNLGGFDEPNWLISSFLGYGGASCGPLDGGIMDSVSYYGPASVDVFRTVTCLLNGNELNYGEMVAASAGIAQAFSPNQQPLTASYQSDFSHTISIVGLSFQDAAGQDITNQVTYISDSGVVYAAPISVPEPATLTLLGAGLAGMNWASRRKAKDVRLQKDKYASRSPPPQC